MSSSFAMESEESGISQDFGSFGDYEDFFDPEEFEELGVDPQVPTDAKPGSDDKVLMLAARYAAGLPLWHDSDRYDHGPGTSDVELEE
ncbi:MAG: hypothetical protein Tsb009_22770 [Planctomycetaceae bacterium]